MAKRIIALMLGLLALLCALPTYAQEDANESVLEAAASVDDQLPARSAILIEQKSGRVLFEKNADEILPPASITKIMTLLLTMEAIEQGKLTYDQKLTCSAYAASMGGSQIWLKEGEQFSVDDLLKATAISSANDASVLLAEAVAGSEEAFVQQMNEKAKELGMTNTTFCNATGLDAPGHLTTARDIAQMSRALLSYPKITEYSSIWMTDLRGGQTQLVNTNKLVRFYDGCTGLKTGTTNDAGSCLAASAVRKGLPLIAVTLGSKTSAERFSAARGLLDYGFANYASVDLPVVESIAPVRVCGGVEKQVQVVCEPPEAVIVKISDKDKIEQEVSLVEEVYAPVESGQALGKVTVRVGQTVLCEYALVAADPVEKMTFLRAFGMLCSSLAQM